MLFPLRASVRSRRLPVFTLGLLLANVVVFWHEINLRAWEVQPFISRYAAIPARLQSPTGSSLFSLISCMFLHASFSHLIGNMWFLWIFGDDVEGKMGRWRFLTFYFVSGLVATVAHAMTNPTSLVSTIGASGAISGVLGAYLYMFPTATITALLFLTPIPRVVEVPAALFLCLWILLQVGAAMSGQQAGIAWYAHIGGFVAGLVLAMVIAKK